MRLIWLLAWFALTLHGTDHVRVILDNSRSMIKNDAPRLAVLSTALLFDLAKPNMSLGDTFQVVTFDPSWPQRKWTVGPPPSQDGPRLIAKHDDRQGFLSSLRAFHYDSWNTYYYPVLKLAIEDLKAVKGGPSDRRIIVLVTDGLPEDPDPLIIARDLLSQLEPNHIRLYVLAFGKDVRDQNETKLREVLKSPGVEILIDQTGSELLRSMVTIFSKSFGYAADNPVIASGPLALDLESNRTPPRVAVVNYWRNPKAPGINLKPPPKGIVNIAEAVHSGEEEGASYSLAWVLTPNSGSYTLTGSPAGTSVAVLRPASLIVQFRAQPPSTQTLFTLAKIQMPLQIVVRPSGTKGDPGSDLQLSFRLHGPQTKEGYEWDGDVLGPAQPTTGVYDKTADARYYNINPIFRPDRPDGGRDFYEGWITVDVKRNDSMLDSGVHRLLVYPYVQLTPTPPILSAMIRGQVRAVQYREIACGAFSFSVDGQLFHPQRPSYSLRAVIDKGLIDDPRLVRARFILDGVPLQMDGLPTQNPSDWYTGRRLNKEELLGQHEFCIQGGKPKMADPGNPVEIPLHFTITETPYDVLPVVQRVTLKALINPPAFLEQYAGWLAMGLGLLMWLLVAWYTRYRPTLSPAMQLASGHVDSAPTAHPLAEGAALRQALGLRIEKAAYADGGKVLLGWVSPVDDDLYLFRCGLGVQVEGSGPPSPTGQLLSTHQQYTAKALGGKEYVIRFDYDAGP